MSLRRMFSKTIISSARFLKMPASSQMLYFHLALNADDDGVVEAFPVIRMVGSNEDDFKILVAKFFITILNDDLVSFVNDWTEHNLIRPDRKVDSKYKNLLIQKIENIKLIDSKPRADRLGRPMDVQCQDMAGEMSAQVRLGKVRLGKKNICPSGDERDFDFEIFWKAYPRKQARKKALSSWKTKRLGRYLDERILPDIQFKMENQYPNGWLDPKTKKILIQYVPMPATYLNQERWEDEIITENSNG